MGLDDFTGGRGSAHSGGRGGGRKKTKLDCSRPYVMIVKDVMGQVTSDVGVTRVLRPQDDPENDYEVLCSFQDRRVWAGFRKRVKEEFDLDADEVLEKNPEMIPKLKTKLAKPEAPDPRRTCAVCGQKMSPDSDEFTVIPLARGTRASMGAKRLPVHKHHTVEELVNANTEQ